MKLCVVIPAYNAARHIEAVLERVAGLVPLGLEQVIVVDDGSRDRTASLVEARQASDPRLRLLVRSQNGGYGAAMKDGLALARECEPEVVACIHADGQYAPEVLPDMIEPTRRAEPR